MKLTLLLTLVAFNLTASVYSQGDKLSVDFSQTTVRNVLKEIEQKTPYSFFFKNDDLQLDKEVTVQTGETEITGILDVLLENTSLEYQLLGSNFIVIAPKQSLQQLTVQGIVTDTEGNPLPGVNIVEVGTNNGTVTDMDGNYTISVASEDATLSFSFMGYLSEEIQVNGQSTIDVILAEDLKALEEVVVVGYGVQKKSLVTGAISSVSAEDIETTAATRVDQAIQGKTAGVMVLPTSGSPGAGTKIRVRGTNSNLESDPLFIVDGMKTGDINNIAPGDIESIEILKDAASAAIYGTEGANGVVLITTKSGVAGESRVSYDFQYGLQSAKTDMELMDAAQYTQWQTEAGNEVRDRFDADTDWLDELFEVAPMQKHHLSFSGGNNKTTYMVSGSFLDQDGIVGGEKANYSRYTGRINLRSEVKEWLEVGTNLSYMNQKRNNVGEDDEYRSLVNSALLVDPLTPITYEGTPDFIQEHLDAGRTILQNDDGEYYSLTENATGEMANPLAVLQTYHDNTLQDKFMGSAYATLKPFEGFSFTSRIGVDLAYQNQHFWNPKYYFSTERSNSTPTVGNNLNKWHTWLWENYATYATTFGDNNLTLLAGYSAERAEGPNWTMFSGPMPTEGDDYAYHSPTLGEELDDVEGNTWVNTLASMFGRVSYDYMGKYMIEASIRRDGADDFPEDNKYAIFPAFSAGWLITEENFFNVGGIDYLKIRGSWGANGSRANIPGNEDKELWEFGMRYPDASGTFLSGAQIAKLVNTNLLWERTEMTDIGLDARFLNNKLTFSVDYYNKVTEDLLTGGTGPFTVGNEYPMVNAGTVSNKGLDFELGYRNLDGDFKYGASVNLSTVKNEVTELKVDAPVRGDNLRGYDLTWFEEGEPIWYFKGYKTDGVDPETGEVIVVDVSENGTIGPEDQTYIGDPHPDMIFGGNFFAEYMGFDLNIYLQGSYGNDIFMGWFRTDRPFTNKPAYFFEDRWTASGDDAEFPAANNTSDFVYRSDLMISDGSYLRVKQIQLGYTLPQDILGEVGIQKIRAYVSLDNYFTFTNYKGLDPEAGSTTNNRLGVDRGIYPAAGVFLFGLTANF
ncbi:MAG: SusC/RagA family TonB-linked outer membrane protein [Bacteroidota bacterium]